MGENILFRVQNSSQISQVVRIAFEREKRRETERP
jgi:hypothetical protein